MLRITVNKSAAAAKKYYSELYYSEGKTAQDYYSEKDQAIGLWHGKAAEKLGLTGYITKEDFASLCDNQIPGTDKQLTERNNKERRVGYDFTFNASKSVSLAYTFANGEDKKAILNAFQESVSEAMSEVENGAQARVRKSKAFQNRETGNIAYGEFVHFTSRPVDGIPDPHLHAHCFVFNATYDGTEQKWKAGEFGQVKKDAPYYEALFHSSLADKLTKLGYEVEKSKNGFEIKGVDRDTIDKFSKRTKEIEIHAAENNITDDKEKSGLGAKTRETKRIMASPEVQFQNWSDRLTPDEKDSLYSLKKQAADEKKKESEVVAQQSIKASLDHYLERKSVSTDKEILAHAIKSSVGLATPSQVQQAFRKEESVISVKDSGQTFITTTDALQEENNLITKAYASKGAFKPILENYKPTDNTLLTDEQKNAVNHALSTSDGITIIAGKAGTGKTTLMKAVQEGIKASGKNMFAFAPSAEASRSVQRKEGFENAETVAHLIQNKVMHPDLKDSVIWIDEAGMLSNKDMNKILDIAQTQNARVILTGDTKQHNSVERGDALRTLQTEGGINSIQVSKIQRQKNEQYKQAVDCLGKSQIEKGFAKLEKTGAIHEIEDHHERITKIADDYFISTYKNTKKDKFQNEVLVVSPTHAEGDTVTRRIREKLKTEKVIKGEDKEYKTLKSLQLTNAEKQQAQNYEANQWLIFHQNIKGFKAGSKYEVVAANSNNEVEVKNGDGKTYTVPLSKSSSYNLFEAKGTAISQGDKIRITGNGKANDGKHLFNGSLFNVTGFDDNGNIKLSNGSTIAKDYGHFALGYVVTSHASQGKTVDKVIISQSSMSFRASSKEQFYVSVSRGRKAVSIYTDDKADLLNAVKQTNERKSARELTRTNAVINHGIAIHRNSFLQQIREKAIAAAEKIKTSFTKQKEMNYELQR